MKDINYNFSIEKINLSKVFKTFRGAMKKAIFYLGLNLPYEKTEELIIIHDIVKNDLSLLKSKLGDLFDVFITDAKIRYCDDILDNVLAKQVPTPVESMKKVVSDFELDMNNDSGDVPTLFKNEIDLIENGSKYDTKTIQEKIKKIIAIRPCDYFLLMDKLIKKFGTSLSLKECSVSLEFFKEFQRVRDLLDDIMSIEEDIIKNDYNSIILGYKHGISYHFFDSLVREKLENLKHYIEKVPNHPNKILFYETVNFWTVEYENLFKPLLMNFYVDLEEFRRSYFMIKQI